MQATEEEPPAELRSPGLVETVGRCRATLMPLPALNRPQLSTQEAPLPAAPPCEEPREPRTRDPEAAVFAFGGLAEDVREDGVNARGWEVLKLEAMRHDIR